MPRRTTAARKPRQRKPPPVGPYDLSGPYRLPGGSELDALGTGFARMQRTTAPNPALLLQSYKDGYVEAAKIANHNLVMDTASALLIADGKQGGILRAMSIPAVRALYGDRLDIVSKSDSDSVADKAFKNAMGMNGRSVTDPIPGDVHTYFAAPNLFIARTATAKKQLIYNNANNPQLLLQTNP